MRRLTAILFAAALLCTITACGAARTKNGEGNAAQAASVENKVALAIDKESYDRDERIEVTLEKSKLDGGEVIVIVGTDVKHGGEAEVHDDNEEYRYLSDFTEQPFYLWAPERDGAFDVRVYANGDGGKELAFVSFSVGAGAPAGSQSKGGAAKEAGAKGEKVFSFPESAFVPAWAEYTGGGKYVFTELENTKLEERGICTYLEGVTLSDVQSYIAMLKEQGLTYAAYAEERLEPGEFGTMSWYGVNSDKSFSVSVNYFDEEQEINDILFNTGTHKYNVQIQVANCDYLN